MAYQTISTCETDQGHRTSSSWKDKPEKIKVIGVAKYEGNGYVRFSTTGGWIKRNGSSYQQLTSRTIAGKPVGSTPSLKKKGKKNKKPVYTLVHGTGTVRKAVYELDPPTSFGSYTLKVHSGSALGDGFEASAGAYVEVSASFSASPFKIVEVTGTAGASVEWSKGREVTSTGLLSDSWDWQVSEKNVCNSHDPPQEITNVHAHHWTCPKDNGGCGKHLQCGPPHSKEPDGHKMQACENDGCNEQNVRECTHDCEHEPEECPRCEENVSTRNEHYKTCGSEVPGTIAGCSVRYWTCQSSTHDVLACGRFNSNGTDVCGMLYRQCTNPRGECLYGWNRWQRHIDGVEICDEGCFGTSCYGCQHLHP